MEIEVGPHLNEAELEQYSMGQLPEARLAVFEEHFLACDGCQDRLLEMEAYVNAMRSVSPKLREAPRSFWGGAWKDLFRAPRPAWAGAFALGTVALAAAIWMAVPPARVERAAVELYAMRGAETVAVSAPAGKPISLNVDVAQLPPAASYRMEIVDSTGKAVWDGAAAAQNGRIAQAVGKTLDPGQYFVRLYSNEGRLLREFSLLATR